MSPGRQEATSEPSKAAKFWGLPWTTYPVKATGMSNFEVRQQSEILFRKNIRIPLLLLQHQFFGCCLWILSLWIECSSATINLFCFPSHFPPELAAVRYSHDKSLFLAALSCQVSWRTRRRRRRWCSHTCSPTGLGPAMARAPPASETSPLTPTFLQHCQNASVQSQCPGEKAEKHLNYFLQKISKRFNCCKSVLIGTEWISDGNLLSFLPVSLPPRSQGNPAGAARNPHLLGSLPGIQPKKSLWLWIWDSPALQFPRHYSSCAAH